MRVLVTRPVEDALRTAQGLSALGHEAVICPLQRVEAMGQGLPDGPFDAVAATSANAVRCIAAGALAAVPLHAVGERTGQAARKAGFRTVRVADGDAASLVARIVAATDMRSHILFLAGQERKPALEEGLRAAGRNLTTVETYRMVEDFAALGRIDWYQIDAVVHYSQGSARRFAAAVQQAGLLQDIAGVRHYCLSRDVAKGLEPLRPARIFVADAPEEASLFSLLAISGS